LSKELHVHYTDEAIKSFMQAKIKETKYLVPKGLTLGSGIGQQCARVYKTETKEIVPMRCRNKPLKTLVTMDVIQFFSHLTSTTVESSWLEIRVEDSNCIDLGQTMAKKLAEILNVRLVLPKVLEGKTVGSINCQYCGQITTNLDKCTHCGARPI
jgi:hypothetical protein